MESRSLNTYCTVQMKMNAWMTFRGELLVLGSVSYNPTPNATKTSRIVRLKEHYVGPLWKENPCVVCIWYSFETPMKIEDHLLDSDMSNNPANYTIFLVQRGRKKTIYCMDWNLEWYILFLDLISVLGDCCKSLEMTAIVGWFGTNISNRC